MPVSHLTLGQMAVADDALATIPGLEIAMPVKKVRHLRLDRLGKQGMRAPRARLR